jgi:iron(III) transport system substrate-binding protein
MNAIFARRLAAALVVTIATSLPGLASAQSVAEIALYKGADRQARLEAGAKKEGKVLVYGIDTQTEGIYEAFNKKYPFLKVEVYRDSGDDVTRKLFEEYKVGRYDPDAFAITLGGLHIMKNAGVLQPFWSPEMEAFRPETLQKDGYWAIVHESYNGLGYNTRLMKEEELPKTYDDLLDPKWKGKFSISSRGTTMVQWVGVMVIEKGEDFVRKLGQQQMKLHNISARALASLMVSEEVPISPTIFSAHVRNDKESGASVGWRALGPVFANNVSMALPAKTSHPHAGMLVIDFMMSMEGQLMRQRLGYASPRKDMPAIEKPEKVYQLPERPDFERESERWTTLAKSAFR